MDIATSASVCYTQWIYSQAKFTLFQLKLKKKTNFSSKMFSKLGILLPISNGVNHINLQNQSLCSIRTIIAGLNARRNSENPLKRYDG